VQETNSPSFEQLIQEMKQKRTLHNKSHKMTRKGYRGKRKGWEEEDAKLAVDKCCASTFLRRPSTERATSTIVHLEFIIARNLKLIQPSLVRCCCMRNLLALF
jgi:hypothetical protein